MHLPDHVSVLVISNGFLPDIFNTAISYIEPNGYELAKLVMQRMMDYPGGQTFSRSIILPSGLVEGKSM